MKIKLRDTFGKTNYNGESEIFNVITVLFSIPAITWSIKTVYLYLTWEPITWLYIRITLLMIATSLVYLLIVFKIDKDHEK